MIQCRSKPPIQVLAIVYRKWFIYLGKKPSLHITLSIFHMPDKGVGLIPHRFPTVIGKSLHIIIDQVGKEDRNTALRYSIGCDS
jgi:hypothetical protein